MSAPSSITDIFTRPTAQVAGQCRTLLDNLSATWRSAGMRGGPLAIEHVFVPAKFDALFAGKPAGRGTSGWGRSLLRVVVDPGEKADLKCFFAGNGIFNAVLETHASEHPFTGLRFNRHVETSFDRGYVYHKGLIAGDEHAVYLDLDYLRERGHLLAEAVRESARQAPRER